MTPSARFAAAIDILDQILGGQVAEKAVSGWGRKNRYAGSKDRAALRDLVYSCLRQKSSAAYYGGHKTGRGLILGLLRKEKFDLALAFSGEKYAPESLTKAELDFEPDLSAAPETTLLDCPDWAAPPLKKYLQDDFEDTLTAFQNRAPFYLRVNRRKATVEQAQELLLTEGIATKPHGLAPYCLEVTDNPRRLRQSPVYLDGLVEIQDCASQAVVEAMPLQDGLKVLDYCAGGGGKSLAISASASVKVTAHDVNVGRMQDLVPRAERAGVKINCVENKAQLTRRGYDLVVVDAPCSGSGTWGRNPESKWSLTSEELEKYTDIQRVILAEAAELVAPNGHLFYITCSVFAAENSEQISNFLDGRPKWQKQSCRQLTPKDGGDGMYYGHVSSP